MIKETIAIKCTCDVCGYTWVPIRDKPPKVCTKCKSHNWNKSDKSQSVKDE